jgi:hypothetical protein
MNRDFNGIKKLKLDADEIMAGRSRPAILTRQSKEKVAQLTDSQNGVTRV